MKYINTYLLKLTCLAALFAMPAYAHDPTPSPSPGGTPKQEPSPTPKASPTPKEEPSPSPKPSPSPSASPKDDHDDGKLSLHGFYRGATSAGGIVLIYIEKNSYIHINALDLAGQTIGFGEGKMENGNFSLALSNDQNITGVAGEHVINGTIADATFQAQRGSEFGGDHKLLGRFTGVAHGPTGESRVMFLIDRAGYIAMIQTSGTKPNLIRTGGFGSVTPPVAPDTTYTFTLDRTVGSSTPITGSFTIIDGVFSGTFTTSAGTYTVNSFKTTVVHRMANISTRGLVGTGQAQLIGGFIITGGPKLVMLRAIGPSLTAHGVSPVLDNPRLELFAKQTSLGANDDWRTNANAANILATGLAPTNDLEAALLVRLEPGAYTTVVSGSGTSEVGIALVEAYEVGRE
jgi:hypothetical protein